MKNKKYRNLFAVEAHFHPGAGIHKNQNKKKLIEQIELDESDSEIDEYYENYE